MTAKPKGVPSRLVRSDPRVTKIQSEVRYGELELAVDHLQKVVAELITRIEVLEHAVDTTIGQMTETLGTLRDAGTVRDRKLLALEAAVSTHDDRIAWLEM